MSILAGILQGVSGLFNAGVSVQNNQQNLAHQRDANAKNEALMRESWAREDNAVQRRKADLEAAGLSPLLAAGSAASSSAPINVSSLKSDLSGLSKGAAEAAQALQMSQAFASKDQEIQLLKNQNKGLQTDNQIKATDLKIKQLEAAQMVKDFDLFGSYKVGSWSRDIYGLSNVFRNHIIPNILNGGGEGTLASGIKDKYIKPVVKPVADFIIDAKDRDWVGDISDSFARFNKRWFNFGRSVDGLNFF